MSRKTKYAVLSALCIIVFWVIENYGVFKTEIDPTTTVISEKELLPSSTTGTVIHHNYYSLSYSEAHEQAEWVAYALKNEHLTYEDRKRPYFYEDPKVKTKSADWRNYKNSGYDRGHYCAAGDRRFSLEAYNETFYTSNISPQKHDFNSGVWNKLEQQVRRWAKRYNEVYVITGGILKGRLKSIGDEDVTVPNYFYKIVTYKVEDRYKAIAFLMPHKESGKRLITFVVSIDELEEKTGIDFFYKLADDVEDSFESEIDLSSWSF